MLRPSPLRLSAAACLLLLSAACHDHDDGVTTMTGTLLSPGSNGAFTFNVPSGPIRRGESFDFMAFDGSKGFVPIASWELRDVNTLALPSNTGSSLVEFPPGFGSVRFVAGNAREYALRAEDFQGRVGYFRFTVDSDRVTLAVTDVVPGTDTDIVVASLVANGTDELYMAERVGDTSAPQRLVRMNRAGDRLSEIIVPYKVQDLAIDQDSQMVAIRTATALPDALVRLDQNFVEDPAFAAPDLGTGAWRELVAMTRSGEILLATDLNGGSILRLDSTGMPIGGSIASSLTALPLPYAEIVDMATDRDGSLFIATDTIIARLLSDGTVDSVYWMPETQTAIRHLATDNLGILYLTAQDADGGQCGSLRRLDWRGTQVRRITDFDSANTEFAARKILDPKALAAQSDGAWHIYDDIVTLDPTVPRAAWLLSGVLDVAGE